ncbi:MULTISPECIES: indolepyruvate oxidoreductase subunit beta [unclassified Adlercreutzia]|uniref:indolepyruvate oxidoreductase subunit beta n=1 Tax=unclassified Adlercreutzia TaxID=2636013 RepID=UPI0013ECE401|nr:MULTISPECIES: indolepyruvate oxidoreductase subunit beta [unclassified Adlercreutzia]
MINILLTGVGGQGTVLAAKVLAQAAQSKGWHVRTAETIGMAQRGGSVVSHVRMGNDGEMVHAPLIFPGTADLIIAFEPGEAARVLPYLATDGLLVTAVTAIQPVTAALSKEPYRANDVLVGIDRAMIADQALSIVHEAEFIHEIGSSKVLNMVLLACAITEGRVPITIDELKSAISLCVKPKFVDMNLRAVDTVVEKHTTECPWFIVKSRLQQQYFSLQ